MKQFKTLMEEINEASDKPISKGIYFGDGKKVSGAIKGKLTLNALYADDTVKTLNWKEWLKLSVKDTSSESVQKEFVAAVAKGLRNIGAEMDFNRFNKKSNPSFDEQIAYLLSNGCKLTKSGVKV